MLPIFHARKTQWLRRYYSRAGLGVGGAGAGKVGDGGHEQDGANSRAI